MSHRTVRTPQRAREAFLGALSAGASIAAACREARIGRTTAYDMRTADADFATAWDEAIEGGTDRLEDEAFRRAHDGVPEPVISSGRQVLDADGVPLVIRRYSDGLLTTLLKARRPDRYKDRVASELKAEVTLDGGGIPALLARVRADAEAKAARGEPSPALARLLPE